MRDNLKVSFVIPGYKCDEFIFRNIEAVLDQDYRNYEIIPVLNGEWPTKGELIKRLSEKYGDKIKLLCPTEPGLAKANNLGFENSTGDIISHMSSDLYIMPGCVRNWVEIFQDKPDVDVAYSGYKLVSPNPLDIYYSCPYDRYHLECEPFIDGASPVRRSAWKPFDPKFKSLIDWDWSLSVTANGKKAFYIKEPLYYAEAPKQGGLSEDSNIHWVKRRRMIQEKHGIPDRKTCITSLMDPDVGLELAKLAEADFRIYPGHKPHEYGLIYCYGFLCDSDNIQRSTGVFFHHFGHKIIQWIGPDLLSLTQMRWQEVDYYTQMVLSKVQNNWCCTKKDESILRRLHLEPETIYPPVIHDDSEEVIDGISVNEEELADELKKSIPDIDFYINNAHCKITVHFDDRIPNILRSICRGNNVITNSFMPGIFHIQGFTNVPEMRKMIVHTIRQIKRKTVADNDETVKFFRERTQPSYFKNKLERIAEKQIKKYAKLEDITENTKGVFN